MNDDTGARVRITAHLELHQTWTPDDIARWESDGADELAATVLAELTQSNHEFLVTLLTNTIPGDTTAGSYSVTITTTDGTTTHVSSASHN